MSAAVYSAAFLLTQSVTISYIRILIIMLYAITDKVKRRTYSHSYVAEVATQ